MRKGFVGAALAAGAVGALTFTFAAAGAPRRAADGACYSPEFTASDAFGGFHVTTHGSVSSGASSIRWDLTEDVVKNRPGVAWGATPGSMDGSLTATLTVPGVDHPIVFTTHCFVDEGVTAVSSVAPAVQPFPRIKVVAEGAVDLPPWTTGDASAVLTMYMYPCGRLCVSSALVAADVHFAHGPGVCNTQEFGQFAYDFTGTGTATSSVSLKGPGTSRRDRANLPAGFTRSYIPCDGLYLAD